MAQLKTQQFSTVILLRHGQPQGGQVFRGATDDVLTEQGWKQMANAVSGLTDIELIMTSPLRRCCEFAVKLADQRALPLLQLEALKEIDFGQWEGKSAQQIESESSAELHRFWQNPIENTPPAGEPLLEFQQRVIDCWHELIMGNRGKNCLIISHGGVQKVILSEVLKMPVQAMHNIEVPYACSSMIHVYYSATEYLTTLKSHG
ncbi:MAG: histidine phosphatase family protein [Gammaproteobacteria bacterium]|nr:histidine phosphatase family protein [Gammaproteobacteria bacterium]